uniref:chitinase n=1 Tax=Aegilops tauschii subsp. strangulata TaxID=200361 RepID=A0A453J3K2_AEGTS
MLRQGHHGDGGGGGCEGGAFYTYDAFVEAASTFRGFGTTGDQATRRRELAAFFAQTSHETTGMYPLLPFCRRVCMYTPTIAAMRDVVAVPTCPCMRAGYCWVKQRSPAGDRYYGRGPMQLTHEHNFRRAGDALGLDLPAGEAGPGVDRPRGGLQDGHLVLDDAATWGAEDAVVPRRDDRRLEAVAPGGSPGTA